MNARDVRAALAYVARQESPPGIVFDTDARIDKQVAIIGAFPANSYPHIVYPVAAVTHSRNPDTARVLDFLAFSAARAIFERYGYSVLPPATEAAGLI